LFVEDLLTNNTNTGWKTLANKLTEYYLRKEEQQQDKSNNKTRATTRQDKMSAAYLQLTEATIAYPTADLEGKEEITLWGPETRHASCVPGAFLRDDDAYYQIHELSTAAGMQWDYGPYRAAVLAITDEMDEWEEHGTAYEEWCQEEANMDDLHEPSLFTEWNQSTSCSNFVGADQMGKNMKVSKFTPEMLTQRDTLNWAYNHLWNNPHFTSIPETHLQVMHEVPNTTELLTLTAVGANHGVAKCEFGAVFVPKGAINHLQHNGGAKVGTIFDGEITFTPGNKFPWRLARDGIKFTYEDMCGTRINDDY